MLCQAKHKGKILVGVFNGRDDAGLKSTPVHQNTAALVYSTAKNKWAHRETLVSEACLLGALLALLPFLLKLLCLVGVVSSRPDDASDVRFLKLRDEEALRARFDGTCTMCGNGT